MNVPWAQRDFLAFSWCKSPPCTVQEDVLRSLRASGLGRRVPEVAVLPGLESLPEQRYAPDRRFVLLWSPAAAPETTAFFSNLQDGWHSLVHALGTLYEHEIYSLRDGAPKPGDDISELQVFRDGGLVRVVRSMRDAGRWDFFEAGELQPWERPEAYRKRLIKHRVTTELLRSYLRAVGLDLAAPAAWLPATTAVEIDWSRAG